MVSVNIKNFVCLHYRVSYRTEDNVKLYQTFYFWKFILWGIFPVGRTIIVREKVHGYSQINGVSYKTHGWESRCPEKIKVLCLEKSNVYFSKKVRII